MILYSVAKMVWEMLFAYGVFNSLMLGLSAFHFVAKTAVEA